MHAPQGFRGRGLDNPRVGGIIFYICSRQPEPPAPPPTMRLNDSEWTVMQAVWELSPASARDLLERVRPETGWAYTTLKTLLARLVEKGALRERKRGNTSFYEPLVTRDAARREAVRSLLDKAFDGTFGALVQHMAASEKLSRKERAKLARMLADLDREGTGR